MRFKKKCVNTFLKVALFLSSKFRLLYDIIIRKSAKLLISADVIFNSAASIQPIEIIERFNNQ